MDEEREQGQQHQSIEELGASVVHTERGTIHTLTIIGHIEGHQVMPPSAKTTKYEHVLPLLAMVEESDEVDGLLVLLNTVGGDIDQTFRIPGIGGWTFHWSSFGSGGKDFIHCPFCGNDDSSGAAFGHSYRREPDVPLF